METFDSLVTCCICLDRYRNPKLLPCQHTFCMEPCMEGLIDYVKRQVKCPECRAEHRIPYKGIQDFPNNVTMQRFLEMYQTISGELPDPNQGQVMERCNVCNEKDYLTLCAHCEKKICQDCRSAHIDVLKREVVRINNQVRRGLHRLYDIQSSVEKNANTIQQNCIAVREEVENIGQRLIKAIKDRTEYLKSEVDAHMSNEVRNLNTLKSNLEQEISNIESNSELAEKHMSDQTEWDDAELVDAKDIFMKTVEFIRNFEHEAPTGSDFRRPIRFSAVQDPNSLSKTLEHFGELNISKKELAEGSQGFGPGGGGGGFPALMPPGVSGSSMGPGLMRSKSDHRLVAQLRQQEERGSGGYGEESGRSSPVSRRRFGERPAARKDSDAGLYDDTASAYDSPCERRHKYRSRYARRNLDLDDDLEAYRPEPSRSMHELATQQTAEHGREKKKERERVLDTEDASRGPLSGIARIADVPRVIQKLTEGEKGPKKKKKEEKEQPQTKAGQVPPTNIPWRRQKSEDDEIAKIKKQNKEADARFSHGAAATPATVPEDTAEPAPTPRASSASRQSAERRASQPSTPTSAPPRPRLSREESGSETEDSTRRRSRVSRPSADAPISEGAHEPPETPRTVQQQSTPPERKVSEPARPSVPAVAAVSRSSSGGSVNRGEERSARAPLRNTWERRVSRSNSSESTSSESSTAGSVNKTGAVFSTNELKSRFMRGGQAPAPPPPPTTEPPRPRFGSNSSTSSRATITSQTAAEPSTPPAGAAQTRPRFQSRFLGRAGTPKAEASKESESSDESSSESESDSSSDSESEDGRRPARASSHGRPAPSMAKTSIGPLLARSAHARQTAETPAAPTPAPASSRAGRSAAASTYGSRRESADYSPTSSTGGGGGSTADRFSSRYGSTANDTADSKPYESRYSSRYGDYSNGLTRSRTSSHLDTRSTAADSDPYTSYGSKYSRASRPSYDDYSTPRYSSYSSRFLNRSKSSAALDEPEEAGRSLTGEGPAPTGPAVAVALDGDRADGRSRYASLAERRSRLARSRSSDRERAEEPGSSGGGSSPSGSVRASMQRQPSGDSGAGADQQTVEPTAAGGASKSEALSSWAQYLKNKYGYKSKDDKERAKAVTRSKSSHLLRLLPGESLLDEPAEQAAPPSPTSPTTAGLPLGSPARNQYMQKGRLKFKMGSRGGGPGCFTWPRGIAVGPDNSIVVADSSNHRVQVFDEGGTFVKEFGQYGNGEAEFDCLAGVCVNRIGQFIISDRYNHRIQIFDPSGRFLRSFGQNGVNDGRFNYPWGVTTDALGFIYVCDKENHRIQVFQSDGTFVGKFGTEGRSSGQLAHPHYIAVSATNRVVVTDSNNHRVQVFDINGKCLNTFGGEGGDEGKFKFPRGVAVDDQGYIVVGDSGNNRIQIFNPDGIFLKAFGCWGSQDGEFKGLEGVAVMPNGNILVCDRENHRVQVF